MTQKEWYVREGTILNYSGNKSEIIAPDNFNNHAVTVIGAGAISPLKKNLSEERIMSRNAITSVCISDGIFGIDDGAFEGCQSLNTVCLPAGLRYIGSKAFSHCESLLEIDMSAISALTIGDNAFSWCTSLKAARMPEQINIPAIAHHCFNGCNLLEKVIMPKDMSSIPMMMFYNCSSLKEMSIPSTVRMIETDSFHCCSALHEITIPPSVNTIGIWAFYGCSSLEQINFSVGLKIIEAGAFKYCGVKEINLPEGLVEIGTGAFEGCRNLETVVVPSSLNVPCDKIFIDCPKLKNFIRK